MLGKRTKAVINFAFGGLFFAISGYSIVRGCLPFRSDCVADVATHIWIIAAVSIALIINGIIRLLLGEERRRSRRETGQGDRRQAARQGGRRECRSAGYRRHGTGPDRENSAEERRAGGRPIAAVGPAARTFGRGFFGPDRGGLAGYLEIPRVGNHRCDACPHGADPPGSSSWRR